LSDFPRPQIKPRILNRPTADTKFYVDFDWWKESEMDLKTYLYQRLPIGDLSSLESDLDEVDLVDPETGEVRRVDGFEYSLQTFFSQLPDDFISRTSVVDAVFCVLLANGNRPLTIRELAKEVDRAPDILLKTLAGSQIYQGIRPIF
jgi:hypothetical protein